MVEAYWEASCQTLRRHARGFHARLRFMGVRIRGVRIRGPLGDIDPLNKVPFKRATSRVQKGPLLGVSLILPWSAF